MTLQDDRNAAFRDMAERLADRALLELGKHPCAPVPQDETERFLTYFLNCYLVGVLGDRAEGPNEVRFREYYWRRALAEPASQGGCA